MVSVIILGFIAGALFVNGLPSLVRGAAGKRHWTPWNRSASPAENVVWGWLNFAVAVLLWHTAPMAAHPRATFLAVSAGVLAMGLALAGMPVKSKE